MDSKLARLLVLIGCILAAFAAGFMAGAVYQEARPFIKRPGSLGSGE